MSTSKPPTVQVARIITATRAEGPGLRSAVWVAGCSLRCHGCFNPHLFDPRAGEPRAPEDVAEALLADTRIEGVTFLGGEPFDQAEALAEVARLVRLNAKTVMIFTGYRLERIKSGIIPGAQALLDLTNILVDGPFIQSRVDAKRPWLGSTNQRILNLATERKGATSGPDRLEVRISTDGAVQINGWATPQQVRHIKALVESFDD